jgi:hypothetical protein
MREGCRSPLVTGVSPVVGAVLPLVAVAARGDLTQLIGLATNDRPDFGPIRAGPGY